MATPNQHVEQYFPVCHISVDFSAISQKKSNKLALISHVTLSNMALLSTSEPSLLAPNTAWLTPTHPISKTSVLSSFPSGFNLDFTAFQLGFLNVFYPLT